MLAKNILVATDFSPIANAALDFAVDLAAKLDARVHLLHVVEITAFFPEVAMAANVFEDIVRPSEAELAKMVDSRKGQARFGEVLVRTGDAREVILKVCEELKIDLLVLGTHGRRGIKRALLGSVAESIVRTSPCPVLTVRAPA